MTLTRPLAAAAVGAVMLALPAVAQDQPQAAPAAAETTAKTDAKPSDSPPDVELTSEEKAEKEARKACKVALCQAFKQDQVFLFNISTGS